MQGWYVVKTDCLQVLFCSNVKLSTKQKQVSISPEL